MVLDCTGLVCPLPVYKAAMAMRKLSPGEVLELIATDPGAQADIPAFARQRGDTLLASIERDGSWVFWLEKS
jgi:tRNA 2-thiouridine synthesizing protein A